MNLYAQEAVDTTVVDLDLSRIKILRRRLTPTDAYELAPAEVRSFLDSFDTLIEKSAEEIYAKSQSGTLTEPYWDPSLKRSRTKRFQLHQALHRSNLLTFRRGRKALVGFFTVKKKDGMQRLIVDCRQSNECHRPPPRTRLATPSGLTALDLDTFGEDSDDLKQHQTSEDIAGKQYSGSTGDVDCFYNFVIPQLSSWFCCDDIVTPRQMRQYGINVQEIYDDDLKAYVKPEDDEKLFPAFYGMPMGWLWSLYLANEIINHQCVLASPEGTAQLIRDKQPPPKVGRGSPAVPGHCLLPRRPGGLPK